MVLFVVVVGGGGVVEIVHLGKMMNNRKMFGGEITRYGDLLEKNNGRQKLVFYTKPSNNGALYKFQGIFKKQILV